MNRYEASLGRVPNPTTVDKDLVRTIRRGAAPAEIAEGLPGLAVPFVANAGQSDPRVAYYASTFSGTVFVTRQGEVVYALPASGHRATAGSREPRSGWTLTESFVDGHPTPVGAQHRRRRT
jgi:hypothetical protein